MLILNAKLMFQSVSVKVNEWRQLNEYVCHTIDVNETVRNHQHVKKERDEFGEISERDDSQNHRESKFEDMASDLKPREEEEEENQ